MAFTWVKLFEISDGYDLMIFAFSTQFKCPSFPHIIGWSPEARGASTGQSGR
jgi:hypothetical protein